MGVVGPVTRAKIRQISCIETPHCTDDYKTCPGGSMVDRVLPTCECMACPGEDKCKDVACLPLADCADPNYEPLVIKRPGECCPSSFKCVPRGTVVPIIESVSGPNNLSVGQKGTWTIKVSDPNNRDLTYSVRWGNEAPIDSTNEISPVAGDIIHVFS